MAQDQTSFLKKTERFEFHNNFWINLHHFLYQQAKVDQVTHAQRNDKTLFDIGDQTIIKNLNSNELNVLNESIQYYKDYITQKSLLHQKDLRFWLQNQNPNKQIIDTSFTKAYRQILNKFSNVYRNHFWENHSARNKKVLFKHFSLIAEMETTMIKQLERLSDYVWPNKKIQVHLTTYANYAGAYSQDGPNSFNIFISTLDPFSNTPNFIEVFFHEGAHSLFTRKSGFRSQLFLISKELKMDISSREWHALWHASLFYLSGRLVEDELKKRKIDYTYATNPFSWFTNDDFISTLEN